MGVQLRSVRGTRSSWLPWEPGARRDAVHCGEKALQPASGSRKYKMPGACSRMRPDVAQEKEVGTEVASRGVILATRRWWGGPGDGSISGEDAGLSWLGRGGGSRGASPPPPCRMLLPSPALRLWMHPLSCGKPARPSVPSDGPGAVGRGAGPSPGPQAGIRCGL